MDVKVIKEELREGIIRDDRNYTIDQVKVKEEMRRGLAAVNQLRVLAAELRRAGIGKGNDDAASIARMNDQSSLILTSFNTAISILKNTAKVIKDDGGDVLNKRNFSSNEGSPCPNNNRRLYFNRRTTQPEPVKTITTDVGIEDGYPWRKYGQKPIVNAKHPREYYRCGHKEEVGCQATKQVQMIAENPSKYKITYYGNHTCQGRLHNACSQLDAILMESVHEESANSIKMLSFDQYNSSGTSAGLKHAGVNPLSMIFSSVTSSNATMIGDQEKPFDVPLHDDHGEQPPAALSSDDPLLLTFDDLMVDMETLLESYPSCMFSPEGNNVMDDEVTDNYNCLMANCADDQVEGDSQISAMINDVGPGDI